MKRRSFLAGLAGAIAMPSVARAQSGGVLRLVVPFPAGGATDVTARLLQDPLARLLEKSVVIDNRGGAGGSIGMGDVARSAPNGLTLGMATSSTHGVNPAVYAKLPYDPIADFTPVTEVVKAPGILVVNPTVVNVSDLAGLIAYAKANPDTVTYASAGNGTISHMWAEQFKSGADIKLMHVPYRGSGPALNDLVAGRIGVYFDQVASALPHVQSGTLRALAVSWPKRLDMLPDVPTYAELGHPESNDPSWFGLVAPKGTPAAEALRVQQAVVTALKDPGLVSRLAALGLYPSGSEPAAFASQIETDIAKMKKLATSARIRID